MKVIIASFLFFGLSWAHLNCNCGWRNTGRIVGGRDANMNEYPWMVSIQYKLNRTHNCGGTIVTPWHIVTAAHCVDKRRPDHFDAVVGRYDTRLAWEQNNNVHPIENYIMHPQYNQGTHNDIALLVTSTEIRYNKFVGPACMPSQNLGQLLAGQYVKATGWGMSSMKEISSQKALKEVDLQVVSYDICKTTMPIQVFSGKQLCTYAPNEDTCPGDSGGPLTWLDPQTNRYTLVGLVSHGYCGQAAKPSIHTDVTAYADWIENLVQSTKNLFTCHKIY